ncbi:MAG TPA: thioredoxin [Armatimonadota bacterium]|nr:thioredoxin [Armatimonadota bacterium]
MSEVPSVTEQDFDQEVLQSELAVLVDFWAPWCGPCRAVAPVVEKVGADLAAKLKTVKCNVDESQALASKYGIRSIPSLLVFRGGEVIDSIVGFLPEAELKKRVEKVIS